MSKKEAAVDLSAIQSLAQFDEESIQFGEADLNDPSLLAELATLTGGGAVVTKSAAPQSTANVTVSKKAAVVEATVTKKEVAVDLKAIQSLAQFDEEAIQFDEADLNDPSLLAELATLSIDGTAVTKSDVLQSSDEPPETLQVSVKPTPDKSSQSHPAVTSTTIAPAVVKPTQDISPQSRPDVTSPVAQDADASPQSQPATTEPTAVKQTQDKSPQSHPAVAPTTATPTAGTLPQDADPRRRAEMLKQLALEAHKRQDREKARQYLVAFKQLEAAIAHSDAAPTAASSPETLAQQYSLIEEEVKKQLATAQQRLEVCCLCC